MALPCVKRVSLSRASSPLAGGPCSVSLADKQQHLVLVMYQRSLQSEEDLPIPGLPLKNSVSTRNTEEIVDTDPWP